jgi:Icc protein
MPGLMDRILRDGHIRTGGSIIHDKWQIILLDSTVPGEVSGHLEQHELDRLEECLAEYPDCHALICLHHPLFLTGSHWLDNGLLLDNPADLFAVIDRHEQVRGVLWGHIHQEFYRKRNIVEYFATPSTMIQFKPNSYDFAVDQKPPGFRWLNLYPDGCIDTGVIYVQNAV